MTISKYLSTILVITATLGLLTIWTASAQEPSALDTQDPRGNDGSFVYVNAETARLEMFIATWNVTERHFNTKGKVIATVKGTEEITWVLDRYAIRRNYTTSTDKAVYRAIGMLSFNDARDKYEAVWFDNASKIGPSIFVGEWNDDTKTMTFSSAMPNADSSTTQLKVVERFLDAQRRFATTYQIDGGTVVKRLEVEYKRAAPCPAKIRGVFSP